MPTATGQTGHRHAIRVGIRMRQQHIKSLAHVQVERRDARHSAEIQLRHLIMPHAVSELPHADPFYIQRDHAALGLVNAAKLLVIRRLARARVSVDIQHHRHSTLQLQWLVQQCRNPPSRHRLEF